MSDFAVSRIKILEAFVSHLMQLKFSSKVRIGFSDSSSTQKSNSSVVANGKAHNDKKFDRLRDLNLFSPIVESNEADVFRQYLTMTTVDETNGWYGGTLMGYQDENSEIYQHYAELIQKISPKILPVMELFENDAEKEKLYADLIRVNMVDSIDDTVIGSEMETALKAYDRHCYSREHVRLEKLLQLLQITETTPKNLDLQVGSQSVAVSKTEEVYNS